VHLLDLLAHRLEVAHDAQRRAHLSRHLLRDVHEQLRLRLLLVPHSHHVDVFGLAFQPEAAADEFVDVHGGMFLVPALQELEECLEVPNLEIEPIEETQHLAVLHVILQLQPESSPVDSASAL